MIQASSQAKINVIKLPEVHGVDKGVDPSVKPEKQILKPPKLAMEPNPQSKPRLRQGRVGLRRKMKIPVQTQPLIQSRNVSQVKEQTLPKQKEGILTPPTKLTTDRSIGQIPGTIIMTEHTIRPIINAEQVPFYPDKLRKPPSRLSDTKTQDNRKITLDLDLDINKDFEENSPYQEGIISEIYQRPDKSQLLKPPELADLINTNNLVQKYLPKQTDIDKIFKIIQRKVLKGTILSANIKKIQVGYLNNPYFKDIYLCSKGFLFKQINFFSRETSFHSLL